MSQRRTALGRGLGALISSPPKHLEPTSTEQDSTSPAVRATQERVNTEKRMPEVAARPTGPQEIEVERIDPNPDQPRREFDPVALEQLARSIGQHGVLQPIVVREAGDRFELIMGERRFRASRLAGRKTVPAVIADIEPDDRLELAIVENVQRQDLNPIELALAYRALAQAGHTQDEIGQKVSMDRSSVANHIRLLDLSRTIQTDVENGRLSMGHAKALLQVQDVEAREALRGKILREALSVRATEKAARELGDPGKRPAREKPKAPVDAPLDADTRAFVERIERHLQTKVKLRPGPDGGGKLEVSYFNLEDLERLGALLLGDAA